MLLLVVLLRGIKTSPLLLPRWPIRNLCLRYRSCPRPTTSTRTSTNPGSEPYTTLDHLGPPHRARTTPPQTPAQVARDLLPSSIPYAPLPSVPASVLFPPVSWHVFLFLFLPVDHCNTKQLKAPLQITDQKHVNLCAFMRGCMELF